MMKLKIKKGSNVQVIAGDDKGKTGAVLDVDPFDMKLQVQGVRIQTKRDKQENTLFKEEGYIHYSNVKLMDGPSSKKKKTKKKKTKAKASKKKTTKKASSASAESPSA